jgi:hypothetical protein
MLAGHVPAREMGMSVAISNETARYFIKRAMLCDPERKFSHKTNRFLMQLAAARQSR